MRRALWLLALCAACASDDAPSSGPDAESHVAVFEYPGGGPPQLDLLVVIDDTVAMAPYQDRMAMLPSVIEQAYLSIGDGLVDMHIAVTTDGTLRRVPAVAGSYVAIRTDFDLARPANFTGTLLDAVTPLTSVGAANTAPYQPLAAVKRVFEENPDGFIRDNASIGIVIISASDDASPGTPADYAQFISATREDPYEIMVSRIVVNPSPRLDELATGFMNRTSTTSLADGDLAGALTVFAQAIRTILRGNCWHVSDIDPITPGPQYDCTFTATIRDVPRVLPPCKLPDDQFCWSLVHSNDGCSDDGYEPLEPEIRPYHFWWFVPPLRAECVVLE